MNTAFFDGFILAVDNALHEWIELTAASENAKSELETLRNILKLAIEDIEEKMEELK